MIFKDYYKILGLENNKTNLEEIKIAFREQAKKYHPDVNDGSFSETRFKDINEAYRILSDNRQKRKYDRIWYSHVGKKIDRQEDMKSRETKTSFFKLLFGNSKMEEKTGRKTNKKVPVKGENVVTQIDVSIEDAFYGTDKKISLRTVEGKMKTFKVKLPVGIRNGEKIRLVGEGKKGLNGAKPGDLFIKVNIEDSNKFKLKGYDIYTNLLLSPWEAALGTRTKIDTIDDSSNVYIPKGIDSGEIIRIPGKGYRDGKGGRGDLVAQIKIVSPKEMTDEETKLYERLKELSEKV